MIAAVLALVLCGCSALPGTAVGGGGVADAPPAALALDASSTSIVEGQRVSARLAVRPTVDLEPVAIPLPVMPESVPILPTEIAAMPPSLSMIEVYVAPSDDADLLTTFDRFDEFQQPRVFRVLERAGEFLHVQVPMRPNGSTGYIRASDVDVTMTDQRILIDLSDRTVTVWDGDDVVFDTTGTIGADATPTPTGSYYVRNVFDWYADSIYGPNVIPLSAYSESIDRINGGEAVVAIHGTHRPELVGQAASLGCIRLDNDTIRELAAIVEPGAPVEIQY